MIRILNETFDVVPFQFPINCLHPLILIPVFLWTFEFVYPRGASFLAVQVQYNKVQASENYLEIHLFWAGKGTCCIPDKGTYGPSISALSATPGNKVQKL